MTLDPGQERIHETSHGYETMARALTLDQAYATAYSHLRRLVLAIARNQLDEVSATVIRANAEVIASKLTRELTELFYDGPLAEKLARPE